ncbi:hypothetical protein ACFL6C_14605, partial [Myxococcota bacterium]
SMTFGGTAVRVSLDITNRLVVVASGGMAYVSASNSVEKSQNGVAALATGGVEYFVHVRHFSVGLEASVLAPFSPFRAFVGISPTVKYTF